MLSTAELLQYFWWSFGPVAVVIFTVILGEHGVPSWGSRKFSHITGNTLAAIYMILTNNFWALVYIVSMSLVIGFTLSLTPVRLLQRTTDLTMREGERRGIMVLNIAMTTSTGILYFGFLSLLGWNHPIIILCGMLSMAIGDGMGEVIGRPFGRHKFRIFAEKSVEGSLAVFLGSFLSYVLSALLVYHLSFLIMVQLLFLALLTMIVEMMSWLFIDNIILPFLIGSVAMYFFYL